MVPTAQEQGEWTIPRRLLAEPIGNKGELQTKDDRMVSAMELKNAPQRGVAHKVDKNKQVKNQVLYEAN